MLQQNLDSLGTISTPDAIKRRFNGVLARFTICLGLWEDSHSPLGSNTVKKRAIFPFFPILEVLLCLVVRRVFQVDEMD